MFYRMLPLGKDNSLLLSEQDMPGIVEQIENARDYGVRLSMSMKFGPNFYGKSIEEAKAKVARGKESWIDTPYLCPAVDGNYLGISPKTGVYWCFLLISRPDIGKIGSVTDGKIDIESRIDLTPETLKQRLRGNCSTERCEYQEICLGGCRSTAMLFAELRGEKEPLYSGMDICMTKVYESKQ
jgi:radical SAM protein with 4Fe4S-binding SPASM domain